MVEDVEQRHEVEEASHEDTPGDLEYQPLEMHIAWLLFALHISSIVYNARPVLFFEDVKEHIVIVTANRIVVEGTELRDHVDSDVADDGEVDVDAGPQDQRVHYRVEEARHEL